MEEESKKFNVRRTLPIIADFKNGGSWAMSPGMWHPPEAGNDSQFTACKKMKTSVLQQQES